MKLLHKIFGDGQGRLQADIPHGWECRVLEPPTLNKSLRDFRIELVPGGDFDVYLARLMLDSSEKRKIGDEEVLKLPRYEDVGRSALVGVLREYLHDALDAKIERYLSDAYVRVREVGDANLIAAKDKFAGALSVPADSPLNAELAAKSAGNEDNATGDGDNGGEKRGEKD